jgi:hypothetical protein
MGDPFNEKAIHNKIMRDLDAKEKRDTRLPTPELDRAIRERLPIYAKGFEHKDKPSADHKSPHEGRQLGEGHSEKKPATEKHNNRPQEKKPYENNSGERRQSNMEGRSTKPTDASTSKHEGKISAKFENSFASKNEGKASSKSSENTNRPVGEAGKLKLNNERNTQHEGRAYGPQEKRGNENKGGNSTSNREGREQSRNTQNDGKESSQQSKHTSEQSTKNLSGRNDTSRTKNY